MPITPVTVALELDPRDLRHLSHLLDRGALECERRSRLASLAKLAMRAGVWSTRADRFRRYATALAEVRPS